jgi:hypothetical protein
MSTYREQAIKVIESQFTDQALIYLLRKEDWTKAAKVLLQYRTPLSELLADLIL